MKHWVVAASAMGLVSIIGIGLFGGPTRWGPALSVDLEKKVSNQKHQVDLLTQQVASLQREQHVGILRGYVQSNGGDIPQRDQHDESRNSESALSVPPTDEELSFLAEQVDEQEAHERAKKRQKYQLISDDMDTRRLQEPVDVSGYRKIHATLSNLKVPVLANVRDDGCSESICRFSLAVQGSTHALAEQLDQATLEAGGERKNWAILRLPDDSVRLFVFKRDVPLRRPSVQEPTLTHETQ